MATNKKTTKKTTKRGQTNKIGCILCKRTLVETNFYTTKSSFYPNGRINVCKQCLKDMVDINDIDSVINALRQVDRPFIPDLWNRSLKAENPFGEYMRLMSSLPQYSEMSFTDGEAKFNREQAKELAKTKKQSIFEESTEFEVTQDMMRFWGSSYSKEDVYKLQEFYEKMKMSYEIETASHEDYLRKICIVSLKMEKALNNDDFSDASKLSTIYDSYMKSAKFQAVQRSASDRTGGMNTFSEWFEYAEKNGFIVKFVEEDRDIVDRTISNMMEFTKNLFYGDPNIQSLFEESVKKLQENGDLEDEEENSEYDEVIYMDFSDDEEESEE